MSTDQPIVDRAEWERTRQQLPEHTVQRSTATTKVGPNPRTKVEVHLSIDHGRVAYPGYLG